LHYFLAFIKKGIEIGKEIQWRQVNSDAQGRQNGVVGVRGKEWVLRVGVVHAEKKRVVRGGRCPF
jgi:hypothetical protein